MDMLLRQFSVGKSRRAEAGLVGARSIAWVVSWVLGFRVDNECLFAFAGGGRGTVDAGVDAEVAGIALVPLIVAAISVEG